MFRYQKVDHCPRPGVHRGTGLTKTSLTLANSGICAGSYGWSWSVKVLAWPFGTKGKHALEKSPGCRRVATLLKQDVDFGNVLIACSLQQIMLGEQRQKHLVEMPCGAGLRRAGLTRCAKPRGPEPEMGRHDVSEKDSDAAIRQIVETLS